MEPCIEIDCSAPQKTIHPDQALADLQVDFYYRFKREQGYSELEISQKRVALENILVPETLEAHQDRLRRCGIQMVPPINS